MRDHDHDGATPDPTSNKLRSIAHGPMFLVTTDSSSNEALGAKGKS